MGDEEIIREIVPSYIKDIQEHLVELSQGVENEDCTSMADHAHALKGIGNSLCLERVSDIAGQMECLCRENDSEAGTLLFPGLETEIERALTLVMQSDWIEKAKIA